MFGECKTRIGVFEAENEKLLNQLDQEKLRVPRLLEQQMNKVLQQARDFVKKELDLQSTRNKREKTQLKAQISELQSKLSHADSKSTMHDLKLAFVKWRVVAMVKKVG